MQCSDSDYKDCAGHTHVSTSKFFGSNKLRNVEIYWLNKCIKKYLKMFKENGYNSFCPVLNRCLLSLLRANLFRLSRLLLRRDLMCRKVNRISYRLSLLCLPNEQWWNIYQVYLDPLSTLFSIKILKLF